MEISSYGTPYSGGSCSSPKAARAARRECKRRPSGARRGRDRRLVISAYGYERQESDAVSEILREAQAQWYVLYPSVFRLDHSHHLFGP